MIDEMMATVDAMREMPVEIAPACCLRTRNLNIQCTRCLDACRENALKWTGREIAVDYDRCTGCLACSLACPTGALQNFGPDDAEVALEAMRVLEKAEGWDCSEKNVVGESAFVRDGDCVDVKDIGSGGNADAEMAICLMCEVLLKERARVVLRDHVVKIRCIAQIDASLLILLASRGVRVVEVAVSHCEECPRQCDAAGLEDVAATANEVLAAFGTSLGVRLSQGVPKTCRYTVAPGYDASRRGMFAEMKQGAQTLVGTAIAQQTVTARGPEPSVYEALRVRGGDSLPTFVPYRRRQLIEAVRSFGDPLDVMWDVPLWGYPVIDAQRCIGCKMCVMFCPTGALHIKREGGEECDDGESSGCIVFRTDLCAKCQTCENVCFVRAVDYSQEVFAVDVVAGSEDILVELDSC